MASFDLVYGDGLRHVKTAFKRAGFSAKMLDNLRPYYQRRRLAQRARKAREARAGAAAEVPASEEARLPAEEAQAERAHVPRNVARWLKQRLRLII